jgi:hypothetical protein
MQAFLDGKMDIPPKKGKGSFDSLSTAFLETMYEVMAKEAENRGMYPLELIREVLSYPIDPTEIVTGSMLDITDLPTQEEIDAEAALCTCEISNKPCPAHDEEDDEETLSDQETSLPDDVPTQADLAETLTCTCEVTLDPCPVHDKEEASNE